jgi:circadian clock protein KaiC
MSKRGVLSAARNSRSPALLPALPKCPTGIAGLDEITEGGLPRGRPTLVCGKAGCGKTLLAMEFIVRGARDLGEPGVFMAFEETEAELAQNVTSLGFDVPSLVRRRKLAVDHVRIERSEIEETGEYDLEGLFVRLGSMIDDLGAKRVALDTIESLFSGLSNESILRAELRRLFRWLKDKGVTALITAEQGKDGMLTRHGLEEYVSDCVVLLDHRMLDEVATRRLRIIKYRGSRHGTSEYPTLIDERGLSVLPISSLGLSYSVTPKTVPTGIPDLDAMLGKKGYWKGGSVLVTGVPGSGKTSLAAAFAEGVCRGGGRCLFISFEEAADQIVRDMASVGIRLGPHLRSGRLRLQAIRPTLIGLEGHLTGIHRLLDRVQPDAVVVDPISGLGAIGGRKDIWAMLTRLVGHLKNNGTTGLFTSQSLDQNDPKTGVAEVWTLMDTLLRLETEKRGYETQRLFTIVKCRGMAHSMMTRELVFSRRGITLRDIDCGG